MGGEIEAGDRAVREAVGEVARLEAERSTCKVRREVVGRGVEERKAERARLEEQLEKVREAVAGELSAAAAQTQAASSYAALVVLRDGVSRAREARLQLQAEQKAKHEARQKRLDMQTAWSEQESKARARIAELQTRREKGAARVVDERQTLATLAAQEAGLESLVQAARQRKTEGDDQLAGIEAVRSEAAEAHRTVTEASAGAREACVRSGAHVESAEQRVAEARARLAEMAPGTPAEIAENNEQSIEELQSAAAYGVAIEAMRTERERLGAVNLRVEEDMREVRDAREALEAESRDLNDALEKFEEAIRALNGEGRTRLRGAFERVNDNFKDMFLVLFGAEAKASLELVDSDDPFEAGLEIYAQPPGKNLISLAQMSGGEKALTALALVFALFLSSPAPFCVLDEVDAPLDDANVVRFCDLLDYLTERTRVRFLVVTHHAITISRVDRLFGVTMAEKGVSQLVSVDYETALEGVGA